MKRGEDVRALKDERRSDALLEEKRQQRDAQDDSKHRHLLGGPGRDAADYRLQERGDSIARMDELLAQRNARGQSRRQNPLAYGEYECDRGDETEHDNGRVEQRSPFLTAIVVLATRREAPDAVRRAMNVVRVLDVRVQHHRLDIVPREVGQVVAERPPFGALAVGEVVL